MSYLGGLDSLKQDFGGERYRSDDGLRDFPEPLGKIVAIIFLPLMRSIDDGDLMEVG